MHRESGTTCLLSITHVLVFCEFYFNCQPLRIHILVIAASIKITKQRKDRHCVNEFKCRVDTTNKNSQ